MDIRKLTDIRFNVEVSEIADFIKANVKPNWLAYALLWLLKITTRKAGIFSFSKTYVLFAATALIAKSSWLVVVVDYFFDESCAFGVILKKLIEIFAGVVDMTVFWPVTIYAFMVAILHYFVEYHRVKSSKGIAELQEQVQKALVHTGTTPAKINLAIDSSCPIPEVHSTRKLLVADLKEKLTSGQLILIYGGIKEGKTILSCLLAKTLDDYEIIRVPFSNENTIDIVQLFKTYQKKSKVIFVFDAVKYETPEYYDAFCELIINEANTSGWLFIINSYDNIPDIVFGSYEGIYSLKIPSLSLDEIKEMIPEDKQSVFAPLLLSLLGGQALLTQMACVMLSENNWSISRTELTQLLTFPRGMKLERKVRTLTNRLVADGEAYHLLNRLLFIGGEFTEEDCCELASLAPIITNPKVRLGQLVGKCIEEKDGVYKISDLLKKTLSIDLIEQEKKDCGRYLTGKILSKKVLSPLDVLRCVTLLTSAGCYDEAASVYILAITLAKEKGLLDHEQFSIIRALWANVSLPKCMTADTRLSIRMTQLTILGSAYIQNISDVEDEINILLTGGEYITPELKSASVQSLIAYHTLSGNGSKITYYKNLSSGFGKPISLRLQSSDILYSSLYAVNNLEQLEDWFVLYNNEGRPVLELINEGAIVTINKLVEGNDEPIDLLKTITAKALDHDLKAFAIVAISKLIDLYSNQNNVDEATTTFNSNSDLLEQPFGALLLNYSYGLCLSSHGNGSEYESYYEKAAESISLKDACMVSYNVACANAQSLGDKGHYDKANEIIQSIVNDSSFNECFSPYEQACVYGSYAYSLWMSGNRPKAIELLLKVEGYLWNEHSRITDEYKSLSMRYDVLVLYMYSILIDKEIDPRFAQPDYGLFNKQAPSLIGGYEPLRNFTALYHVYVLTDMYCSEEECIRVIEHMLQIQGVDGQGNGHMLSVMIEAYPLLLAHGRKDLVEYIVLRAFADSVDAKTEIRIDYEQLILLNVLRCILCYRICCLAESVDFDDEWIYTLVEKSIVYLDNHSRTTAIIEQMMAETPDYSILTDNMDRALVALYHIKDFDARECLNLLYQTTSTLDSLSRVPSAKRQIEVFAKSFAKMMIMHNPDRFNIKKEDIDSYFGKIHGKHGIDYAKAIMSGLYYQMKFTPIMDKVIKDIVE